MKEPWQSDEQDPSSSLKKGDPVLDHWVDIIIKMKNDMGSEAFNEFAINLAKEEEAKGLRERNPEHPLLKLLDAHRSREEKGFF